MQKSDLKINSHNIIYSSKERGRMFQYFLSKKSFFFTFKLIFMIIYLLFRLLQEFNRNGWKLSASLNISSKYHATKRVNILFLYSLAWEHGVAQGTHSYPRCLPTHSMYAASISAGSNQGSVMCLLSILNQQKLHGGNIYLSIQRIIQ